MKKNIWKRMGRVLTPDYLKNIGVTHPIPAFVEPTSDKNIIKIYFNTRSKANMSEVRSLLFDMKFFKVLEVSDTLFKHGSIGTFDEHGVEICSIVKENDCKSLFYQAWSRSYSTPAFCSIGMAMMNKDSKIIRPYLGPVLTRTIKEPYGCAAPFVLKEKDRYIMWYSSVDEILELDGRAVEKYNIKIAISGDGIDWTKLNKTAINYANDEEFAFGRPFVLFENNTYKMWYCFKGKNYKIGYSESADGIEWTRKDDMNYFEKSNEKWDAEMMEYPLVFDHQGSRYILYCGEGYGKTGFGLARLEK